MSATNDSEELEALFDSVSAEAAPAPVVSPVVESPAAQVDAGGDDETLQALFDSVASDFSEGQAAFGPAQHASESAGGEVSVAQEAVFNRIGGMARELHDTLRELGYDKLLEDTISVLPDAQDRLAYVANLTEQAACRVLNATDVACPLVDQIETDARDLGVRWDHLFANQLSVAEFKKLASETREFLNSGLPEKARSTHAQLTEIMMAQDFQDLTGQVIKRVVSLAQSLENGLMAALVELIPEARRTAEVSQLMNGPVINPAGRNDVVVNQQQVDDLLDSLGF